MDPIFCNAFVDFNVPGKPNPPPSKLTATVWKQSRFLPTATLGKTAIIFTNPGGNLASSSVPLNMWVTQAEYAVERSQQNTMRKSCIEGSPLVFKDMHNGDNKLVQIRPGNLLVIVPFGDDNR